MPLRTIFKILSFSFLLSMVGARANAQTPTLDLQTAASRLAGVNSQTWVFTRLEMVMGSTGGCTSGEAWTFFADHRVEIDVCENQRLVTKILNWSLSREDALDTLVVVGNTRYRLMFWQESSARFMGLRSISQRIVDPRFDKRFRLQKAE